MKTLIAFIFGFMTGCFFGLYQTVEVSDGVAVHIVRGIKTIIEVFGQ